MAEHQSIGSPGAEPAKIFADALAERFKGFEPCGPFDGVDADTVGRSVIDGGKHRHHPFVEGHRGCAVGAPDLIRPVGDDLAGMLVFGDPWTAGWRQQLGLPHQTKHAGLGGADVLRTQTRPYLPMAFPMERAGGYLLPDQLSQLRIGVTGLGSAFGRRASRVALSGFDGIERRSRNLPDSGNGRNAVGFVSGRRGRLTYGLDFQNPKGRFFSINRIFSLSSSLLTASSATTDFNCAFSASSISVSRLFSPDSPPARNASRQLEMVAAVTPCLRLRVSRSSPRKRSITTDTLRRADHRPRPTSASDSGASPVALRAPSEAPESMFFPFDIQLLLVPDYCPRNSWRAIIHHYICFNAD